MAQTTVKGIRSGEKIRRIIEITLILCIIIPCISTVHAAEIKHSGKSGDIDWSIDSEGCLTLSGSGEYQKNEWRQYASEIKTAKVDIENITDLSLLFNGCMALTDIDFQHLDTSQVTSIAGMFYDCRGLTSLDLSSFHTSKVTNMGGVFYGCSNLEKINFSGWNTSKVTDMQEMFYGCSSLSEISVSGFDTGNVTNMEAMFYDCGGLLSLDLGGFTTTNVLSMNAMFCRCENLAILDLHSFDMSKCEGTNEMFSYCWSLENIRTPYHLKANIALPSSSGKEWRDEQGTVYTEFPKNTDRSVLLTLKGVRKKGDINADGDITMTDLLKCLHHVSGRTLLTGDAFFAADINDDGVVKMTDLLQILYYVSGRNMEL